jgi:hypothetical protein
LRAKNARIRRPTGMLFQAETVSLPSDRLISAPKFNVTYKAVAEDQT